MSDHSVFISYSRRDRKKVFPVVKELETLFGEHSCWVDTEGIESDAQFVEVIVNAIEKAQILLFFHSSNSAKSEWTKKEVDYAASLHKKIVIVKIDSAPLSGYFQFQYGGHDVIDYSIAEQREKLFRNLGKWLNSPVIPRKRKKWWIVVTAAAVLFLAAVPVIIIHHSKVTTAVDVSAETFIDTSAVASIPQQEVSVAPRAHVQSIIRAEDQPKTEMEQHSFNTKGIVAAEEPTSICRGGFYRTTTPTSDSRIALIIGNSGYKSGETLKNVPNDIELVKGRLLALGFDVFVYNDCSGREMFEKYKLFRQKAVSYKADLFYYSGHGIQNIEGNVYNEFLLGVDCSAGEYPAKSFSITDVIPDDNGTHIVIVDACRTSHPSNMEKALTLEVPSGVCLLFSTRSGQTAGDEGVNGCSFFATEFAGGIGTGRSVSDEFDRIRLRVKAACLQEPMVQNALTSSFYFSGKAKAESVEPVPAPQQYEYSEQEIADAKAYARSKWRSLKKDGWSLLEMADPESLISEYTLAARHGQSFIGTAEACISTNMGKSIARNNAVNEYCSLAEGKVKGEICSSLSNEDGNQAESYLSSYRNEFSKYIQSEMKLYMTFVRTRNGKVDVLEYFIVDKGRFEYLVNKTKQQIIR